MSRRTWSNRRTVEECRSLEIASLVSSGLFRCPSPQWQTFVSRGLEIRVTTESVTPDDGVRTFRGNTFVRPPAGRVRLGFTLGTECRTEARDLPGGGRAFLHCGSQHINQEVEIVATPAPLGRGWRYFFKCPGIDGPCDRRVGKLYMPPGEEYFACRDCHDLTYRSCQEHSKRLDRFLRLRPKNLAHALESPDTMTRLLAVRAALRMRGTVSKG